MTEQQNVDLKTYRIVETKLYGEITKICRRYSNELSLISMLGILDVIKDEMVDLDKRNRALTNRQDRPAVTKSGIPIDKSQLESIG